MSRENRVQGEIKLSRNCCQNMTSAAKGRDDHSIKIGGALSSVKDNSEPIQFASSEKIKEHFPYECSKRSVRWIPGTVFTCWWGNILHVFLNAMFWGLTDTFFADLLPHMRDVFPVRWILCPVFRCNIHFLQVETIPKYRAHSLVLA